MTRDSSGNDCTVGGERVEALLMLPAWSKGESTLMGKLRSETRGAGVKVTVLDLGDGKYTASYRVLPAGAYELSVTIDGEHIVHVGNDCGRWAKERGDADSKNVT